MSSAVRLAQFRERRRQRGLKETTVWLSAEDDRRLMELVRERGLKSKSEALEYALRQVFPKEESSMTT